MNVSIVRKCECFPRCLDTETVTEKELQNIWQGIEESLRLERSKNREKEAQMKRKVMFMDGMQYVEKNISVTLLEMAQVWTNISGVNGSGVN